MCLLARDNNITDDMEEVGYVQELSQDNYQVHVNNMMRSGVRAQTGKRRRPMYLFGGTIGVSRYPLYINNNLETAMLPRPVTLSRPGRPGHDFMQTTPWLQDLVLDISELTLKHLLHIGNENSELTLRYINLSLTQIPSCLRICNSFFTSMILVGDEECDGDIPLHTDNDDLVSAILNLGDETLTGGSTIFTNGVNTKVTGEVVKTVTFKHGRLQIGNFEHVFHGTTPWKGKRWTLSFSLNRHVLNHFLDEGSYYYDKFVKAQYPSNMFVAA